MQSSVNRKDYELVSLFEGIGIRMHVTKAMTPNKTRFHWHREMEIMLMMNGSMAIHTERESFLLHSDDILFINANEPHCLQKTDAIGDVLVLQFPDTFCKTYYPLLGFCEFQDRYLTSCSHPQAHAKLYELTTDIAKQFCRRQNGYQLAVIGKLNLLMYEILQNIRYEVVAEEKVQSYKVNQKRINDIINIIHENFTSKLTLSDIADKIGLDMYYLSHFIKKYLGLSYQQYVTKLRLHKAAYLLLNRNLKKVDLCMESGFSDYRYIREAFYKEFGCDPDEFKEKYQERMINNGYTNSLMGDQYVVLDFEESCEVFQKYIDRQGR